MLTLLNKIKDKTKNNKLSSVINSELKDFGIDSKRPGIDSKYC